MKARGNYQQPQPKATTEFVGANGRYTLVRKAGSGSFGSALLVRRESDKQLFIIKEVNLSRMNPREREEARHECKVLQLLNHPNVVRYEEHFERRNVLYIVMEYADGGDLHQKIMNQRNNLMREETVLHYFVQMCLALDYLHSRHILHRDIKAMNIFLTSNGTVKLGDFGISTILRNTMGMANTVCGTPFYFSPELCRNRPYNNKTDVWALGVVLFEMLSLKHPFDASNLNQLMQRILRNPTPGVPSIYSPHVRELVFWCLEKEHQKRPSVRALLQKDVMKRALLRLQADLGHATGTNQRLQQVVAERISEQQQQQQPGGAAAAAVVPAPSSSAAAAAQQQQQQQQAKELKEQREKEQREKEQRERDSHLQSSFPASLGHLIKRNRAVVVSGSSMREMYSYDFAVLVPLHPFRTIEKRRQILVMLAALLRSSTAPPLAACSNNSENSNVTPPPARAARAADALFFFEVLKSSPGGLGSVLQQMRNNNKNSNNSNSVSDAVRNLPHAKRLLAQQDGPATLARLIDAMSLVEGVGDVDIANDFGTPSTKWHDAETKQVRQHVSKIVDECEKDCTIIARRSWSFDEPVGVEPL